MQMNLSPFIVAVFFTVWCIFNPVVAVLEKYFPTVPEELKSYVAMPYLIIIN